MAEDIEYGHAQFGVGITTDGRVILRIVEEENVDEIIFEMVINIEQTRHLIELLEKAVNITFLGGLGKNNLTM